MSQFRSSLVRLLPVSAMAIALAACASSPPATVDQDSAPMRVQAVDSEPICAFKFKQSFEGNTDGWFPLDEDSPYLKRVGPGYSNDGGYADNIRAAKGGHHARVFKGAGGPFTRWGCYNPEFPEDGYTTELDIYLDTAWASDHTGKNFDWSSAINNGETPPLHRRDFIFNAETTEDGFLIAASNNAPGHPASGVAPVTITESGWYTFQHVFRNEDGVLEVDFNIFERETGDLVATWTRSTPSDEIPDAVGGNRYGWMVNNEIPELAIDEAIKTTN